MAGAETPGDTSPRFLGQQPQHPGGFPQQGHGQYTPGGTSCLLSGWSGRHCPGTEGIQRPARGQGGLSRARGAAPGPPALLGPPRAHPGTRAWTQAGGPARPAGQTAPPGGRAQAGTLTTAGTRQSSGTPRLPGLGTAPLAAPLGPLSGPSCGSGAPPSPNPGGSRSTALRSNRRRTPAKRGAGRAHARTLTRMHAHTQAHTSTPRTDGDSGLTAIADPVFPTMRTAKEAVLTPGRTWALTFQQVKAAFSPTSELGLRVHHKAAPGACGPAALAGPPGALLQPAQEWSEGPPGPVRALSAPHSTARVLPAAPQLWGSQRTRAAPCSKP